VIGQVYIEGDLRVAGVVEGEVEVTGDVEIDEMAKVKASVSGGDVSVRGHLTGPVVARKRLVVARSGALIGDVRVARLVIQDGATFSGKISMGGALEAPAPAKAPEAPPAALPEPEPEPKPAADAANVKPAPGLKPQVATPAAVPVKPAPTKPQVVPTAAKPPPTMVAPVVAARVDGKGGGKGSGKDGGKAKTAAPQPKSKTKRR
jgi:cytoskeletal protein CcmA (bactofilin family)